MGQRFRKDVALELMSDQRLPGDTLFLVAEEDFRLEDTPEDQRRRAVLAGTAEPPAAVTLRSAAAVATSKAAAATKWAAKSGVPAPPVPKTLTEKWEKKDLR